MFRITLLVITLCSWQSVEGSTPNRAVSYARHKVLRVHPTNQEQVNIVRALESQGRFMRGVDVWNEPLAIGSIDLHVTPEVCDDVTATFNISGIAYEVLIDDIQRLIAEQKAESDRHRRGLRSRRLTTGYVGSGHRRSRRSSQVSWVNSSRSVNSRRRTSRRDVQDGIVTREELTDFIDSYNTYDEIVDWLFLAQQYRPDIANIQVIGRSYEGRPLYLIQLGERRSTVKPAVWIDGGIHAREWISPATAIYFIYMLLTGYEVDAQVTTLLAEFDWYILPVMNPDGYVYSHTTDRMWRKTRSRVNNLRRCQGVDANRNFDFQWLRECEAQRPCRGRNPCDDVFAGRRPFSEPETIGVANWIIANRDRVKLYISLHSYSQLWLIPWGYTMTHPGDYDDLMRSSRSAVNTLEAVNQTRYTIGSPAEILYAATGGSYDWAKGVAGVKYSFTIELRDLGSYGFLLPRSQIIPTGQETWAGVQKMALEVKMDECWMTGLGCSKDMMTY